MDSIDRRDGSAVTGLGPGTRLGLYLTFAAAVFLPYGLNLLVIAGAWAWAMTNESRDIRLMILLTGLSLAGSMLWAFLPA